MTWKEIKDWVNANPLGLHDDVPTAICIEIEDVAEELKDFGISGSCPAEETQDVFANAVITDGSQRSGEEIV